jgi:Zn-dependent protease
MTESQDAIRYDFFKHFTTISAAGIGLLIGFADRIVATGVPQWSISVLFIQFGTSLVLSLVFMGAAALRPSSEATVELRFIAFVGGLVSVVMFGLAVLNLGFLTCKVFGLPT